jgi:hypothetical protein
LDKGVSQNPFIQSWRTILHSDRTLTRRYASYMGSASRFIRSANLAAGTLLVLSCVPVHAQQQRQQTQQTTQSQNQNDAGAAQRDAASFNEFLNQHPDVEKQLHANPYLINDPNFLSTQPALRAFLAEHPHVKGQLQQSPVDFIRHENNGEGASSNPGNAGRINNSGAVPSERETGRMDEFLDEHRDIEQQLELNPALINDPNYLSQHHDLQALLNAHPQIRQEFSANPQYFTQRDQTSSANGEPNYREIGRMDQFLDVHQELRWQLKQNPLLVNDSQYLGQHPELALFLNAHAEVRQEFSEHPEYFDLVEEPAETRRAATNVTTATNAPTTGTPSAPRPAATGGEAAAPTHATADVSDVNHAKPSAPAVDPNREFAKQERTRIDQFLDDHPNITKDLEKNPWLINQSKYLKHHKELERFLAEHPEVRQKVAANPPFFMERQNEGGFEHASADGVWRTMGPNGGLNDHDVALMDQFLVKHKKTAKELGKDPMLVTSQHYLDHNKDLRKFFEQHPQILVEFRQNPRNFMQREDQLRAQLR